MTLKHHAHYAITVPEHERWGVPRRDTLGKYDAIKDGFEIVAGLCSVVFVPAKFVQVVQRLPT